MDKKCGYHTKPHKKKVTFALEAANAGKVHLAGEFNSWNPAEYPMKKNANGKWVKQLSLPPGEFEYKFIVDDQWVTDPQNEHSCTNCFGTNNSVINVVP